MPEITIPHNWTPSWYMEMVLKSPYRFQVLNWHRKARKTSLAVNKLILESFQHQAVYWYVGPSYGLAKRTVWDDPQMLPRYIPGWNDNSSKIMQRKETEMKIEILPTKSQIYVFGADRPELMRGPNPRGVILDEYAVQKKEVWLEVIAPIMRANPQAWCWFLFTPKGRNHAYDAFKLGMEMGNEWKSWQLDATQSGIFEQEQLIMAKREMPEEIFNQEFMCQFIEGAGQVFRGVRACMTAQPQSPIAGHIYVIGADLAKTHDYTVLTVYDRSGNNQVYQDRISEIDWSYQKDKIKALSEYYNRALVVIDATGLGDPVADDLARMGVPIEPVKLTSQVKSGLIEKLMLWIQQKKIKLLPIQESILEFDDYSYDVSISGNVRYQAREGSHDDIVISHALAISALTPLVSAPKLEDDQNATPLARFYRSLFGKNSTEQDRREWEGL